MRVIVAPDKFAGTLTATQAATAICVGWARSAPGDELASVPLSDGGPGFRDVLHGALGGELVPVTVTGPLGGRVRAAVLVHDRTAYVESAEAAGLHLVEEGERDPARASSYGVGELVAAALETGAERIVVGLGGTATNDGGAGALAALGAAPGETLRAGGSALAGARPVDLAPARRRLGGVRLVVATDVDAPLLGPSGATHGFATQKGADRTLRDRLEEAMREWATATDGGVAGRAGAGAAGGLGFGLMLLGAERVPGAELAVEATGLAARAAASDLLVTGEGAFDWQSLRGKVVAGVARVGTQTGRPVVVLAGRVDVGRRELAAAGVDSAYAVADLPVADLPVADPPVADRPGADRPGADGPGADGAAGDVHHSPGDRLALLAERVSRSWSH